MLQSFRFLSSLGLFACAIGMAFALYVQSLGYEPCPMCIFQRVAMVGAGVFFFLGILLAGGRRGRWLSAALAGLASAAGAVIAGRHVWLQSLPADQVPACGPTLDYLRDMFPLGEVVMMVLKGDGNCAKIDAAWLGISLPGWTLVAFIGLALYAFAMPLVARRG